MKSAIRFIRMLLMISVPVSGFCEQANIASGGPIVILAGQEFDMWSWAPSGYMRLVADELDERGIKDSSLILIDRKKTGELRDQIEESVVAKIPAYVLLLPGASDYNPWEKAPVPESFKGNLTAIVEKLRAAGIRTVLATSYPAAHNLPLELNKNVSEYNAFIRQLASDQGVELLDLVKLVDEEKKAVPFDGNSVAKALVNQIYAAGILRSIGFDEAEVTACRAAWLDKPGTIQLPPLISVNTFEKLKSQSADAPDPDAYLSAILEKKLSPLSNP